MNLAPTDLDPSRALHPETLGHAPGRGRLQGRRVLVIGAGQRVIPEEDPPIGNGRAISVLFAREGAQVACVDVKAEAVQATVDQITAEGGKAHAFVADVLDTARIAPLVAQAAEAMGGLDGLVLNVGISHGLPFDRITPETWDKEYGVNVKSHMFFSQAALPLMTPGGSIVLMSRSPACAMRAATPPMNLRKPHRCRSHAPSPSPVSPRASAATPCCPA